MKSNFKLPARVKRRITDITASRSLSIATLQQYSLSYSETQAVLSSLLNSDSAVAAGRPGGTESEGVRQLLKRRLGRSQRPYSRWFREHAPLFSGITFQDEGDLDFFNSYYLSSIFNLDFVFHGAFAPGVVDLLASRTLAGTPVAESHALIPLFAREANVAPWTASLAGRSVLVIHPFEESIQQQYKRKKKIPAIDEILPDFSLQTCSPPVVFAGESNGLIWSDNYKVLCERISNLSFDVALVSGGSFGLPVSSFIKSELGRKAIHIGGALQLLFGIRGQRWDSYPRLRPFIDDNWVRPSRHEIPAGHSKVEGGAYW